MEGGQLRADDERLSPRAPPAGSGPRTRAQAPATGPDLTGPADYRALYEHSPDAVLFTSPDGRIIACNPAACELLGRSAEEICADGRGAVLDPEDPRWATLLAQRAATGRARGVARILRADGTAPDVEVISQVFRHSDGTERTCTVLHDLTALRSAQLASREQRELADTVFDNAPVGMAVVDPGTERFVRVNAALCHLLGYDEAELLAGTFRKITHPDEVALSQALVERLRGGESGPIEVDKRYIRRSGESIWVRLSVTAVRGPGGEELYRIAQVADRTAERASAEALARLAAIVESSRDAIFSTDADGVITSWNPAAERLFGYRAVEALGRPASFTDLAGEDSRRFERTLEAIRSGRSLGDVERAQLTKDGRRVEVLMTISPVTNANGEVVGSSTIARDVTDVRRAARVIADSEARFRSAFENAPIGMAIHDLDGRFLQVNRALCSILGYGAQELIGTGFQAITHPEDLPGDVELMEAMRRQGFDTGRREKRFVRSDGHVVWTQTEATVLRDADGVAQQVLSQVIDITDRKRMDEELRHLAEHDSLTGLVNRRRLELALDHHIAHVARYSDRGALLVVDIDHFKTINDTLGHSVGDRMLRAVADALRRRRRATDTVARLGGDEFALLLPEADARAAEDVAAQILADIREHAVVTIGRQPRALTACVGIALLRQDIVNGDQALVEADLAMYDAKESGRDRYRLHAEDSDEQAAGRIGLVWNERIRDALRDDRFTLYAQPIIDLPTGRIAHFELLLRMPDGRGGLISPATFIPIAERYDLIQQIDRWVIRRAIDVVAAHAGTAPPLTVQVNISAKSLADEGLGAFIEATLTARGARPTDLIFEVTETAAVANLSRARLLAEHLARIGCRLALDDFGAGYGSFHYLKQIPFDYLKIDREFVTNCLTDRTDRLVVESLVTIAKGLGKQTIAEGVETPETERFLRDRGIDYAQGHHIAAPEPLAALLARHGIGPSGPIDPPGSTPIP